MKRRKNKINITNYQESLFNKYEVDESYLQNRKQRRACLELLEKIDKEKNFNEKKVLKKVINAFKGTELHKKIATCMTITSLIMNLQTSLVVADVTSAYQIATQPAKTEQQIENNTNVIMDEDSFLQDQFMIEQGVENTSIQLVVKKDIDPLQEKNSAFIDEDSEINYYENIKALTVIDTSIEDWEVLTLGVEEGEILLLEGEDDPLDMIISKLAEMKEVDSLNIISHGSSGKLHFEDKIISSETLEENREKWQTLGKYLSKDGDVQLFGCNVAKGEKGKAFIENLAHITGADVAASINPTGNDELGGDWKLESVVGNVEEHNVLKSKGIDKFNHILGHTHDNYCYEAECMGPCKDNGGGGGGYEPYIPQPSNNAPVFDSGASISINIDENASAKDIKSQLSATDSDGDSLTWSQNSAPAKGIFNVSGVGSGSGSLSPTTATFTPNTNTIGSDSFTVKVTDGTDTDTITVNVSINDVNPAIDDKVVSIDENTPNGTSVTTVSATNDTNGLTYSISSGNTGNAFAINSSTGEIIVNDVSKLDYETTPSYTLTIAVDDEDSDSVIDDTANITINLNDLVELDSDGTITAGDGVDESITIGIPTTADTVDEAIEIFDFKITDGGIADTKNLTVTSIDINVSSADANKLTYILTNPSDGGDLSGTVTGNYSGGKVTFDLRSNNIVVNDGTNETYVVRAYFNNNSGVTDNTAIAVSIDGDTDVTVDGSGTQMASDQSAVTNSDNARMSVAVTSLSFTTQPAGSVSGSPLSTQPVVSAVDAFGNVDKDFTETITLTENSAGSLSGDVDVTAVAGIATFTDIVYTAIADGESFTLKANDEDGIDSDLSTVDSNSVTSDVAEAAPVASSVSISGTAQVGETLIGSYIYSDVNGDTEGTSTFKWYRSDNASGMNKTEISGATNKKYTLTNADLGKYISFEITPVASSGTSPGSAVESSATGGIVVAPTYSIIAIDNQTMSQRIVGYVSGSQETKSITITKSGTGNLVNLSVALGGTNANSFEITQPVATTLDDSKTSTSFTVKAKDGLAEGTYTATVTVSANNMNNVTFNVTQVVAAKPLSTDCDVTAITKPSGAIKNGTNITANVAYTTTSSIVDVAVSKNATWKLYSDANCINEITNRTMNLNVGANTAYIKVIAENGTTTKTYKIAITRSVAPDSSAPYIIGTNPTNNAVDVEVYKKIEITFSEDLLAGSKIDLMTLKKGNTVVEHVYGIDDNKLTVNPKIDLDYGTLYTLTIPEQTVTDAVYNSLEDEYVLNFTTEKILSSNADLSGINLSNVSLTPAFNPDQTKYTASVGYSVNTITITPTKDNNHKKISVNGKEVTSGQASESINLNVGSNTITIVVTAEDQTTKTYKIEVAREAKKDSGSSSSGGSSSNPSQPESGSQTGSKVIVNGEEETAGKETIKEENGQKNVELIVNSEILNKKIEEVTMKEEDNVVEVAVEAKDADKVETVLTGDIVKKMDEKEFKLFIKTDEIDYIIPAKEVGIDQVSEILGVKMDSLEDIKVEVQIEKLDSKIVKEIEEKAKAQDYEVVFPPVEFKVVAKTTDTSGEVKSTEISKFSSYVERVMEIPEGVDPSKITTGIVYNADGTFSHIPTEVFKKGDKWFAKLNSLTNSSYSVIWNPITVESVENHWSKEYVNDLASRLVIKNPENFKPDESITRGEFAEYITKAIGVYRTKVAKSGQFTDVEVNNELADAITIAVDYGIIKGYPDGTFRPDGKINREEAMTMYAKAMDIVKLSEGDYNRIESYKDKKQVSPWAYDFVKKTISANVFNGRTKETIVPQGTFTYAEASVAIENLLIEAELINERKK